MSQSLYVLGSNGSGQLGLGHEDDVNTPTRVFLPVDLELDRIVRICSGGNHTVLLTKSGGVWTAGQYNGGIASSFKKLEVVDKIKLCAATWSAVTLVTEDDRVLSCGSGDNGELGLGENVTSAPLLREVKVPDRNGQSVIDIQGCLSHTVIVLSDGTVLAWGNGRQGQCGEPADVVWRPKVLQNMPFPVKTALCGKDFSCIFSRPPSTLAAVIGVNKRDRFSVKDTPKTLHNVSKAVATWGSVLTLDQAGSITAWGRNDHGQLGPDELRDIVDVAAGSEHVLALTSDGRVLAWGWGEHGNCGLPLDEQKDVKGRVNELQVPGHVRMIAAGCATSFIVTEEG